MLNEDPFRPPRPPRFLDPCLARRVNFIDGTSAPPFATMPFPVLNPTSEPSSMVLFEPNFNRSLLATMAHSASPEPPSMTLRDSLVKMSVQLLGPLTMALNLIMTSLLRSYSVML